jgi:signal transduction histidine kinase
MKVLIADDEPIARRRLESFLTKWGKQVVAASDGAAAWRLLQQEEFPIVITDWMMPEIDGVELIRRIRAQPHPHYVYVILLTARSEKEDLVQGMEAGADDFLSKPFDHNELRVRLRQGERVIQLERSLAEQNRALRETQAALVQQEKLASLGQLAAGMAHEINNPAAYVSNNLAVLKRDVSAALNVLDRYKGGFDAEAARLEVDIDLTAIRETLPLLFDKSLQGMQRIREIVRNLSDFARLEEADFKEVDLNAALVSTGEVLRHELKQRQIELRLQPGELPPVLCHPGKINQVFLNVLLNAAQASIPNGLIEVRTRPLPEDGILIEFEDHGSGIQPEHLPHIFEPFFTTKPVGQGSGLGLAVSYGILRDHGGSIEVESTVGKGSLFRIRLPLRPPRC